MKGTLALSWGPYGGFYVQRTRLCLGWVAITYVPAVEVDEMMRAWADEADPLDLTTRITAALQRAGVEPLVANAGRPLDELVAELTDRQRERERERIRARLEALPAFEPMDLDVVLAGEPCAAGEGEYS